MTQREMDRLTNTLLNILEEETDEKIRCWKSYMKAKEDNQEEQMQIFLNCYHMARGKIKVTLEILDELYKLTKEKEED